MTIFYVVAGLSVWLGLGWLGHLNADRHFKKKFGDGCPEMAPFILIGPLNLLATLLAFGWRL